MRHFLHAKWLSLFLSLAASSAQAWTLLWSDDFESEGNSRISESSVTMTYAPNPLGTGQSLLFTDVGNTATWGAELSANQGSGGTRVFTLADYGAVAGVDKVIYTYDLFIPVNTVSAGDAFGSFLRFLSDESVDGGTASGGAKTYDPNSYAKGVWHTITQEININAQANNNQPGGSGTSPTTRISIFLSFNDVDGGNPAGPLFYVDNIRVAVTPEPTQTTLGMIGLGALLLRRKRMKR